VYDNYFPRYQFFIFYTFHPDTLYLCDRRMYSNVQYEPVSDLRFSRHYAEVHFGALYWVAEIIFTTVKIFLQNITEKSVSTFMGKYENLKTVALAQMKY
jgi:hypothetical protein